MGFYTAEGGWAPYPAFDHPEDVFFRSLSPKEVKEFRQYARDNDPPEDGTRLKIMHPVCRDVWVAERKLPRPEPVRRDSRVSFGIDWYATESEADFISEYVSRTETINGGWRDGEPCGRAPEFDQDGLSAVIRA